VRESVVRPCASFCQATLPVAPSYAFSSTTVPVWSAAVVSRCVAPSYAYVVVRPTASVTFHRRPLASYWNVVVFAGLPQSDTLHSRPGEHVSYVNDSDPRPAGSATAESRPAVSYVRADAVPAPSATDVRRPVASNFHAPPSWCTAV
jgi:hypothetical protein